MGLFYYLLIENQYFVGPPFAVITAEILFGKLLTRFLQSSEVIAFHSRRRQRFRSSLLLIVWRLILRFNKPHKYSLGFRSGDWAGQSRSSVLFSRNHDIVRADLWHGALCCWILHHPCSCHQKVS